jgi:hypothetical protein
MIGSTFKSAAIAGSEVARTVPSMFSRNRALAITNGRIMPLGTQPRPFSDTFATLFSALIRQIP